MAAPKMNRKKSFSERIGESGGIDARIWVFFSVALIYVCYWINDSTVYQNTILATIPGTEISTTAATAGPGLRASSSNADSGISAWRAKTERSCKALLDDTTSKKPKLIEKEKLERKAVQSLTVPATVNEAPMEGHSKYKFCRNVFIDLGTNIGDSIGYFVDNVLDVCTTTWLEKEPNTKISRGFPRIRLNVTSLQLMNEGSDKRNPLHGLLQNELNKDKDRPIQPESFCVYGMEGNPTFTKRLQKLENFITSIEPAPVQHLHIHTESVVTSDDGPTKLYLDKTSVAENFWGSSILSSQQDAQKSAKELGNGTVFSANVEGIRLSSLVKNTALAFKPGATEEEKAGGLVIVKMDVEGAEYQVVKEVAASGVLCDLVKMGNRVSMIVEYHVNSITDPVERAREHKGHSEAKKTLEECGVVIGKLHAFWS